MMDYNSALRVADNVAIAVGGAAILGGEFGVGAGTNVAVAGITTAGTVVAAPEGALVAAGGAATVAASELVKGAGIMLMANSVANKAGGYERGRAGKETGSYTITFKSTTKSRKV